MSATFTLPSTPSDADNLATELGELATATEWKRAALVYARVRVQGRDGRPVKELTAKDDRLSPEQYAQRGIHGLRSKTTVRAYWHAWDNAITEGLVQPASLGDTVELPEAEWADYYAITPQCDPWANTSPRDAPNRPHFTGGRTVVERHTSFAIDDDSDDDDLGLGECPPLANDPPVERNRSTTTTRQSPSKRALRRKYVEYLAWAEEDVERAHETLGEMGELDDDDTHLLEPLEAIRAALSAVETRISDRLGLGRVTGELRM